MGNGWIGFDRQLIYVLGSVGARKEDGRFLIWGSAVTYMGASEEVVLGEDAECEVEGRRVRIVPLMTGTSYGSPVTVI